MINSVFDNFTLHLHFTTLKRLSLSNAQYPAQKVQNANPPLTSSTCRCYCGIEWMTFMSASLNVTKVGNSWQTINMIKEYYAYCNKEAENVSYEFPLAVLISGGFEAYLLMLHWFFPWSQRLGLAIPEYSVVCWLTNLKHRIG